MHGRNAGSRRIRPVLRFSLLLPLVAAASLAAQPEVLPPGLRATPPVALTPVRLTTARTSDRLIAVVPSDAGFRAYYERHAQLDANTELRTVRFGVDGTVDAATDRAVFPARAVRTFLQVEATAAGPRLFWLDGARNVRFSRTAADGSATDAAGIVVAAATNEFDAGCNESHCLVQSWQHSFDDASLATIVTADGAIAATRTLPPSFALTGGVDPEGFLIAGNDRGLHVLHIDNDGTPRHFDAVVQSGRNVASRVADFDGEQYALVWSNADEQAADYGTYAARISRNGTVSTPVKIADFGRASSEPRDAALAWNGRTHVYVRREPAGASRLPDFLPPTMLSAQSFDRDFRPVTPPQPLNSAVGAMEVAVAPALLGDVVFVGWAELSGTLGELSVMRGARVEPDGAVHRADPLFRLPTPQIPEALALAGGRTLAVFSEKDTDATRRYYPRADAVLRFLRLTASGTVLDATPIVLSPSFDADLGVAAAALGDEVLVVWNRGPEPDDRLEAAIVHMADGTLERIPLPLQARDASFAAAASANAWLVTAGGSFVVLSRTGLLVTPQPVQYTTARTAGPTAASDGSGFLVAAAEYAPLQQRGEGPTRMTLVGAGGAIAVPEQTLAPAAYAVAATFVAGRYLVASAARSGSSIQFDRVSADGAITARNVTAVPSFFLGDLQLVPLGSGVLLANNGYNLWFPANGLLPSGGWFPFGFPGAIAATPRHTALGLRTVAGDGMTFPLVLQELITSDFRRGAAHP